MRVSAQRQSTSSYTSTWCVSVTHPVYTSIYIYSMHSPQAAPHDCGWHLLCTTTHPAVQCVRTKGNNVSCRPIKTTTTAVATTATKTTPSPPRQDEGATSSRRLWELPTGATQILRDSISRCCCCCCAHFAWLVVVFDPMCMFVCMCV